MKKIIAINAGSSSLKYKLFEMPEEEVICSGIAERIGKEDAIFTIKYQGNKESETLPILDHSKAVSILMDKLISKGIIKSYDEIKATGHRVVQGGEYFSDSALFTDEVEKKIESLIPLAPLHNGPNLIGYRAFKQILPFAPAVAVFDTAFHQTMEKVDYTYPIPYEYSEKYHIRRYGAHGTSHKYLSEMSMKYLGDSKKVICCHIGSGASISAINNGKCVVTSMGLTPLGGIMMGTRTGDMDPSIMKFCCASDNKTTEEMFNIFNKKSGLLGVSGVSDDSRDVMKAYREGNPRAILAYDMFVRRICDFIGSYYVRLGGCDLIIFSAGIGENSSDTRKMICDNLKDALGVLIDDKINEETKAVEAVISKKESKIKVVVIPTDEEVMIARDAYKISK